MPSQCKVDLGQIDGKRIAVILVKGDPVNPEVMHRITGKALFRNGCLLLTE